MMFGTGIIAGIRRMLGLPDYGGPSYFYNEARLDKLGSIWRERWAGTEPYIEFRPDDEVLDIGCAEGMIAIEVARHVRRVHGFEVLPHRIDMARKFIAEAGVSNVTVEVESIETIPLAPLSYDIVLFAGVYGMALPNGRSIGVPELRKALVATRRLHVMRLNVQDDPRAERWLPEIIATADELGFDVAAFPKFDRYENLIIAARRGSGARLKTAPQLMLLPTVCVREHPVIGDAPLAPWRFGRPA
jgi:SAM-dependent methyltransferase